jgi:hypothetical protein
MIRDLSIKLLITGCIVSALCSVISFVLMRKRLSGRGAVVRSALFHGLLGFLLTVPCVSIWAHYSLPSFRYWWAFVVAPFCLAPIATLSLLIGAILAMRMKPGNSSWKMNRIVAFAVPIGSALLCFIPKFLPKPDRAQNTWQPSAGAESSRAEYEFLFLPEKGLLELPANQVEVTAVKTIGKVQHIMTTHRQMPLICFYSEGALHLVDTTRAKITASLPTSGIPEKMSLSPDGTQIIYRLKDTQLYVVGTFASRESVMLPVTDSTPAEGQILWWKSNLVVVYPEGQSPLIWNLDILETFQTSEVPEWTKQSGAELAHLQAPETLFSAPSRWTLEKADVVAGITKNEQANIWLPSQMSSYCLTDQHIPYKRDMTASLGINPKDSIFMLPSGDRAQWLHGNELRLIYFGPKSAFRKTYSLHMPCAPADISPNGTLLYAIKSKSLFAMVYAPVINPLNGLIVGPNRSQIRGMIRFHDWAGKDAQFWETEMQSTIQVNDVVSDFYHIDNNENATPIRMNSSSKFIVIKEFSQSRDIPIPTRKELSSLIGASARAEDKTTTEPSTLLGTRTEATPAAPSLEADLRKFILKHHQKATEGDVHGMVADYADEVDFLDKGRVLPEFILEEERKYRGSLIEGRENVEGEIQITQANDQYQVKYVLVLNWHGKSSKKGVTKVEMDLTVIESEGLFYITRQKSKRL